MILPRVDRWTLWWYTGGTSQRSLLRIRSYRGCGEILSQMAPALASPVVLLVDDDADTRAMYRVALEMRGYAIAEASTAAEARCLARSGRTALAVLDNRLPDGDAPELCRALRDDPATRTIAMIVLSGDSMAAAQVDVLRAIGCDTVLTKPCLPEELSDCIEQVLRRRPSSQAMAAIQ
jgi:DNA-binding response OmpR family regulator